MADINTLLASVAPVTTGMTVAQVVDAASQVAGPATLKQIIDLRVAATALSDAIASAPSTPAPANAAAVYNFVLTPTVSVQYVDAYLAAKHAAQGCLASPPTNTWDDFAKALFVLMKAVLAATPHLAEL